MAVAWGVAVLGWLVIALIPNSYEAKARLFVQTQSILPNQIGITPDERNNQLLRLKQTITSNDNLVRVVRRTDLNSLVASERDLSGVVAGAARSGSRSPPSPTARSRSRRARTFPASPTARTRAPPPPPSRA